MANNVQITAGSGTTVETIDQGSGVERQVITIGSIGNAAGQTQLSGGQKTSANSIPVVLASDQSVIPTNPSPSALSAIAIAPKVAASASNVVGKASAGNLYEVVVNVGATAGYVFKFNATSLPGNGAVIAGTASGNYQDCVFVPANGTYSWTASGDPPESFSTGITIVFSSTGPGTLTAATAAFLRARTV